ncbi:hypothetical protein UQ94_23860, partial [Shigella boydii]
GEHITSVQVAKFSVPLQTNLYFKIREDRRKAARGE